MTLFTQALKYSKELQKDMVLFFVEIDHEEFHYLYHNFKWCLLFWLNI